MAWTQQGLKYSLKATSGNYETFSSWDLKTIQEMDSYSHFIDKKRTKEATCFQGMPCNLRLLVGESCSKATQKCHVKTRIIFHSIILSHHCWRWPMSSAVGFWLCSKSASESSLDIQLHTFLLQAPNKTQNQKPSAHLLAQGPSQAHPADRNRKHSAASANFT